MNAFGIDSVPVFALVLIRTGGMMLAAPVFGNSVVPVPVRVGLSFALALLFAPLVGSPAVPTGPATFALAAVGELAIGLLIGFAASLLFAAVQLAGHLIDQDLGISLAATLDPISNEQVSIVSQFKTALAVTVYLLINGHHFLVACTLESFRAVPVAGLAWPPAITPGLVGDMAARLFAAALGLAAPALATLFLVTVAMAFLARTVPEMNLLTLGYPMRILVGYAALAVGVGFFVHAFARFMAGHESSIRSVLPLLGGRP
jgi:flagellar biosynthetic protein FliR